MFNIEDMMPNEGGGKFLYEITRRITENIAYFLPKNINVQEVCLSTIFFFLVTYLKIPFWALL